MNDGFIHSRGAEGQSKKSREHLPPFLSDNEDLQKKFIRHCTSTLNELSIDGAREFVIEQLIPMGFPLTSDFTDADWKEMLQRLYGLSDTPAWSTIWEWLVRCGFTYTKRKKRYFVDTHESAANRKYRKEQTSRYLWRERWMYRWYQLPLHEVTALTSEGFLVPCKGYNYETINGEKMVEFHVDDIPEINIIDSKTENKLHTKIEEECPFGGSLSIHKDINEKPLLAFGHDECIFWQFILTGQARVGVKGELPIIPKDEGFGIMVSAFQSREFGLGFELTIDDLKVVNEYRYSSRPNYTETESAIKLLGGAKKNLTEAPFVKYFEYGCGQGKEGYGTYDNMALQFEDCVDCIQALFPQFESNTNITGRRLPGNALTKAGSWRCSKYGVCK